ncbi:mucin-2-like protein [Lates japonicus]|uniref:Mucin-2-like protein n=1 Tax=Lates japonicus TaxID=270547 RepID=A0AAD3MWX4_LATJO|nr:mucin-2-like protein [Lates japonicus]
MAVAYSAVTQPGLLSQQYPPPLLPKPGKDNVRLQKLLKRTAKKKASAQASQSAAPFRSSLSPVNEASPDLEHSDHSTPPRTPETPSNLYSNQQPPRFTVRPLYQHVASPYPQRATYGRATRFSPQTVGIPSYSYSQHVTTVSSYSSSAYHTGVSSALGPVAQPAVPKISMPASSVSETTVPATDVKKSAFSTSAESHAGPRHAVAVATPQPKATSLGPTPYTAAGGQAVIRPLTVLTPLVKSKSPRPTFKATEPSRSPKPMFDVPQIRMYTASTSYYETSRTPPVYDTAELTAIGGTVPPNKIQAETKQDLTPVSEVRRDPATPAVTSYGYQRPKTPTYEASRLMSTSPGYKRPRTPTGVSPVAFQRPKTPSQVAQKSKSGYRGLTPSEYAAYGGIKTYTPAFGISGSKAATQEEVSKDGSAESQSKTPSQEPSVKAPSTAEVSKVKETPKDVDKPNLRDEKVSSTPSIPIIVVSQASDASGTTITQETSTVTSQVTVKQEEIVIQETPKAKPPPAEVKTPEKQKVETPVQEVIKPKTKSPEAKHPLPKGGDQDPLKAVRKLLGKDKVPTAEQKAGTETKVKVSEQKEPAKPATTTRTQAEGSKPAPALLTKAPAAESAESEDKGKDKKAEAAVKPASEKKEGDECLPAAEPLLKVIQKPKGVKSKVSGWSRLKKHMVVEQEEPKFPEVGSQKETTGQDQNEVKKADEKADDNSGTQDENQTKDAPKATKMWDAVLFQMFSTKENIMHQIELNKSEEEKKEQVKDELNEIPSFAYRLPVLLFSPRFDAKKLKEAASRPVTKISTVFEMGLIGRKGKEEEQKDFNRTARGFTAT